MNAKILTVLGVLALAAPTVAAGAVGPNDYVASNRAWLRSQAAEANPQLLEDPEVLAHIEQLARGAAAIDLAAPPGTQAHFPLDNIHVGEIWSICINWWWPWFGPDCTVHVKLGLGDCFGSVTIDWAYYQWLGTDIIVDVPEGDHYPWTDAHLGTGILGHHHWSGTHAGTVCVLINSPNISWVASNGIATFDV